MTDLWDERYTPSDAAIIKHKARSLIGHYGYRRGDEKDIQQELAMHVFQKTHRHDGRKASRGTFVAHIADNKVRNMIEYRTAKKRNARRNVPLKDMGDGVLLDGSISTVRLIRQLAVREAVARMPNDLQQVAILLGTYSPAEVQRMLHLPRGQVRSRMQRIGAILDAAELNPRKED